MFVRFMMPCVLLCLAPALVRAQQITDEGPTNEDLMQQIRSIKDDLADRVRANESSLANLKLELDELRAQMNQDVERQRQILDAISTQDSSGQPIPRLSSIMQQSEEFRQDVAGAVHESLQTEGRLTVANRTNSHRRIFVNRREYGIDAGKTLTLKLPVGTVTTRLPGESLKNWTLTAPGYQQGIDIVPATDSTVTVLRPTTSAPVQTTYYSAPVQTAYYAAEPTTAYYPATTTYYAPTTTYYAPTTTYYAPTATATYAYYPSSNYVYYPSTSYYSSFYVWP